MKNDKNKINRNLDTHLLHFLILRGAFLIAGRLSLHMSTFSILAPASGILSNSNLHPEKKKWEFK